MDSRPIGIFDSGVGGLTVLAALRRRLPDESLLYLGDTARLPYGTKSPATVVRYAQQAARVLVDSGIKALVVADNTSSAHALAALAKAFPEIPIAGVTEPGAKAAAFGVLASGTGIRASGTGTRASGAVAVVATEGVVRSRLYPRLIRRWTPSARVKARSCGLLVALAEEALTDGPLAERMVRHVLAPLLGSFRPDSLLLGCTHLPPLRSVIRRVVGPDVPLVDSADATADSVADLLSSLGLEAPPDVGASVRYLVTDTPDRFVRLAPVFLDGCPFAPDDVTQIPL